MNKRHLRIAVKDSVRLLPYAVMGILFSAVVTLASRVQAGDTRVPWDFIVIWAISVLSIFVMMLIVFYFAARKRDQDRSVNSRRKTLSD